MTPQTPNRNGPNSGVVLYKCFQSSFCKAFGEIHFKSELYSLLLVWLYNSGLTQIESTFLTQMGSLETFRLVFISYEGVYV